MAHVRSDAVSIDVVAFVEPNQEDVSAAEIKAKLGPLLQRLRKWQGHVSFLATADTIAAIGDSLSQLRTVHFLHALLVHGETKGGRGVDLEPEGAEGKDMLPQTAASSALKQIVDISASAPVDTIRRAILLWQFFGGQQRQDRTLRYKVFGRRGGKHDFGSDDLKRAAAEGLLHAASSLNLIRGERGGDVDVECVAQMHHRRFDLLLRLHPSSRLDKQFVSANKRALRMAERGETPAPQIPEDVAASERPHAVGVTPEAGSASIPTDAAFFAEDACDGLPEPTEDWVRKFSLVRQEQAARQPVNLADVAASITSDRAGGSEGADEASAVRFAVAPLYSMDLHEQRRLKAEEARGILLRAVRRLRKLWRAHVAELAKFNAKGPRAEEVLGMLEKLTWPKCESRRNVMPAGVNFIYAFTLGLVNDYTHGPAMSLHTRKQSRLTKMLTGFARRSVPDFPFTSIQCNRDYSSRLHVDGNNHGPSYIIGLGEYSGGEVWVLDPEGDAELAIIEELPGWPSLVVGSRARGRLLDIQNKWAKFDGNLPHMTMPFKGSRISLVYFTLRSWMQLPAEQGVALRDFDFNVPTAEYASAATCVGQMERSASLGKPNLGDPSGVYAPTEGCRRPSEQQPADAASDCRGADATMNDVLSNALAREPGGPIIAQVPSWLEPREDTPCCCAVGEILVSREAPCRNKIHLHVGFAPGDNHRLAVGFRLGAADTDGTLRVGKARGMPHVPEWFADIAERFEVFLNERSAFPQPLRRPPARGKRQAPAPSGIWGGLVLRASRRTMQMLVIVQCASRGVTAPSAVAREDLWEAELGKLVGALQEGTCHGGMTLSSVSLEDEDACGQDGERLRVLTGDPSISENLLGLKLRVSAASFFQVDTAAAETLFDLVLHCCLARDVAAVSSGEVLERRAVGGDGVGPDAAKTTILDICCGTGAIALCAASVCSRAIGVDVCAPAIVDAAANACANGLSDRTRFICAPVEQAIEGMLDEAIVTGDTGGDAGFVAVLDPPRAGLKPSVCEALRRCAAIRRIVFVSCNPSGRYTRYDYVVKHGSLADNLVVLCGPRPDEQGRPFRVVAAWPVDMFPHTPHLELVLVLEREGAL